MGPLFVTLHTSLKIGGIVSISYYAMLAVMFSGVIGRYLYVQIPRTLSGEELTLKEIQSRKNVITGLLHKEYQLDHQTLDRIEHFASLAHIGGSWRNLMHAIADDISRPFKLYKLRNELRQNCQQLPADKLDSLLRIIQEKSLLQRKMVLLSSIQKLFHYWHVAHKPFAYVMIIIMFIHISVTILFGYKWIF
jgi:hypothetical protein